ncbi:MAG: mechanosensitive ion channel family protein, partial [Cytophagales bacterium]
MDSEKIMDQIYNLSMEYGPKLISALVVLILGLWIIKGLSGAFSRVLSKREVDPSLVPFLKGLVNTLLRVMLLITVLSMLGIEMTSFIAILGAAGLAVGLALSGT